MSNMSSTVGTMAITANSEKEVYGVLNALHDMLDQEDATYITDFQVEEAVWVSPKFTPEHPYKVTYEVEFHGYGHDTYEDSIYYMRYWLKGNRYLLNHYWEAKFDYSDEEKGCNVLCQKVITVAHEAGEPFENLQFATLEESDYQYSAFNLYRIMGYGSDVIEEVFLDDDKEKVLDDSIESLKEIELVSSKEAKTEVLKVLPWLA